MKQIILISTIAVILFSYSNVFAKDTSASSIVIDQDTGRILYENNPNEQRLIASTTKIMTAILTIENTNINQTIEVGQEILKMYGTNIYIEVGEKMKIKDLLYGLLLRSGNDAATTLAHYVGGTEENFVLMMNEKAKEIGMTNTIFSNPHGLDDYTANYSTAYDMSLLSRYANQNKTYKKISQTRKYTTKTQNKSYLWYNRNKLLTTYEYCTGGKNGYTPKAGRTLVTTATKDNMNLTIVTLNDPNEYETHTWLYEKIFSEYKNYIIINKNNFKTNKQIYNGAATIKESFVYPLTETEKKQITTEIHLLKKQDISKKIGYIDIKLKDKKIGKVFIYKQDTKKEDISIFVKIKNYFDEILKKFILGLQKSLNPGPFVPIPLDTYKSLLSTR